MRSPGWGPHEGISALKEEMPESLLPLCPLLSVSTEEKPCEDTGRRRQSASQEESSYQDANWSAP